MVTSDEEDDWNSESSEDDGDGAGCEDEVEEVIFSQHQQSVTVPNPFCFAGEKRGQGKQSWTRPEDTEGVGGTDHGWSYKLRDSQVLKLNMLGTHAVIA
jgi:hypothetical protein